MAVAFLRRFKNVLGVFRSFLWSDGDEIVSVGGDGVDSGNRYRRVI